MKIEQVIPAEPGWFVETCEGRVHEQVAAWALTESRNLQAVINGGHVSSGMWQRCDATSIHEAEACREDFEATVAFALERYGPMQMSDLRVRMAQRLGREVYQVHQATLLKVLKTRDMFEKSREGWALVSAPALTMAGIR